MFPAHAGMNRLRTSSIVARPVFPAHAGMNRHVEHGLRDIVPGVPRTRGDEPLRNRSRSKGVAVFPAHAGMNRAAGGSWLGTGVPRTRGDEPIGWRPLFGGEVFPAHAGMNRLRPMATTPPLCSPHTRG